MSSTILEKKDFGNITFFLYKSPYNNSNGDQRQNWIYERKPFFSPFIEDLWQLYEHSTSFSEWAIEIGDRRKFIRSPLLIALLNEKGSGDKDSQMHIKRVIGVAWTDSIYKNISRDRKNAEKASESHILTDPNYQGRGIGRAMLALHEEKLRTWKLI